MRKNLASSSSSEAKNIWNVSLSSCCHKQFKFRISVSLTPIFELKLECYISMSFIVIFVYRVNVQTFSSSNNPYVDSAALSFVQSTYFWPSVVNYERSHDGYNTEIRPYILHSEPFFSLSTTIRHHRAD